MTWHILAKQDLFTKVTRIYALIGQRYSTSEIALFQNRNLCFCKCLKLKYSALTSTGCAFVIRRAIAVFSLSKDTLLLGSSGHFHVKNAPLNNILSLNDISGIIHFSAAPHPSTSRGFCCRYIYSSALSSVLNDCENLSVFLNEPLKIFRCGTVASVWWVFSSLQISSYMFELLVGRKMEG